MLIDQLKEIYIAGELDIVETANWNPKITRKDYMVGMENTATAVVDDPDQPLYESYACDSDRNFTGYCDRELEQAFHRQSREPTRKSARRWFGTSMPSCSRTAPGRCSFTPAAPPAGTRGSKA